MEGSCIFDGKVTQQLLQIVLIVVKLSINVTCNVTILILGIYPMEIKLYIH